MRSCFCRYPTIEQYSSPFGGVGLCSRSKGALCGTMDTNSFCLGAQYKPLFICWALYTHCLFRQLIVHLVYLDPFRHCHFRILLSWEDTAFKISNSKILKITNRIYKITNRISALSEQLHGNFNCIYQIFNKKMMTFLLFACEQSRWGRGGGKGWKPYMFCVWDLS